MEAIGDIIQCSICLETFTDPRMLPCIHTFCLKCLQKIPVKREYPYPIPGKLRCPICEMEFSIPKQGVESFEKNFFMIRLKEIATLTKPFDKSCDICLESKECDEDEVLPAGVYCMQCHRNICRRCNKAHQITAELKAHQLIPLGTAIPGDMLKTISQQDCSRHENELVKMYCNDCREVICMVCFAEKHQNHKCSTVDKVGDTFGQELKEILNEVEACVNGRLRKIRRCTDEKAIFERNVKNIEQNVISRKNELIALIEKYGQSLLDELASIRQTRLKEIQNEMDENKRQLVIIESFIVYCNHIEAKGTNVELCQIVPALKHRAKELQQTLRTLPKQPTELIHVTFEQSNVQEILKTDNAIGSIKVASDSIRSSGILDIPSSSWICGVTKLENKIYALCENPNVIRIFHDQYPFDLQKQIELNEMMRPREIASSEISKCLYIREEFDGSIWKVTTDDFRVTKWLTRVGTERARLSVTSEGHLLVTDRLPTQLKIYNFDAELIRHVPLPRNICNPQHAIQTKNGEFIIIHQDGTRNEPWVISRLTSDGQTVIGSFPPKDKARISNSSCHLALDSDSDRLFVADCNKDSVMLIDSNSLNLIKILPIKKDKYLYGNLPCGLVYDAEKIQLIVGQSPNTVYVYEVI